MSAAGSSEGDRQAYALRVFTLGRFALEVNGKALRFSGKTQRKPLQLIKALVALGGESAPVGPLTESLWPDSEGDRAYRAFTSTLFHLRKLVGQGLLLLQDGRLSLDADACWVDAREFTRLLTEAERAVAGGHGAEASPLLDRALELYRGPFLDGEFDPPEVLSARERLHGMFLRHIEQLGQYFQDTQQFALATRLYQRGVEIDGLAEEIYRSLMRCLERQGRSAEALAVYQRCRNVFQAQLGIEPSPETEALHRRIADESRKPRAPVEAPIASHAPLNGPALSAAPPAEPAPEPQPLPQSAPALVSVPGTPPAPQPAEAAAEGERRPATIVFMDLVGYTELTERLDPEALEEVIGRMRATALQVVSAQGGIVNQFVGDEVMALFGIPSAQEDDPRRAVRTAQDLHEAIARIGDEVLETIGAPLQLHTGVATGRILARLEEGPGGRYGVTGPAVTTASRLASLAKPGEILLAPETHQLVAPFFRTEPLQPVVLRGKQAPLMPYRVVGLSRVRSGFEAARARGLTPFVGREEDLMLLQKAIRLTAQGKGQFVSVAGDAGMGKSRLLFEFRHGSELDAFSVLQGSCQPQGRKIPYLPFLNVLRQGLRLRDNDRPVRLVEKIRRNVSAINPALEAYIPHFLHLLSIKGPGHELPEALQGEELRRQLEQAMAAIITMNLQHRPMVMIMEDWHWCDEASDGLLRTMASVVAEYPLMVVASYRQDYAAHWGNLGHHTPIVLKALESPQAERVVRAVAGTSEVPAELMERIVERAEGNPFFIEELSRAMLEQGALSHPQDAPRTAEATRAEGLPDSVQAIIRARTDRLDPRTRSVLRLAAVIGGEFTGTVLERLAPHADELPQALEALKRLELIQQTRAFPEAIYRFNHAITHEVVYEGLLLRQRARLHGQVGETIEALYADRLEEHYESLAFHYGNSANRQKALEYLERAGDKAAGVYSLVEARKHYRTAMALLDELAPDPDVQRRRCDIAVKWGQVSFYSPSRDLVNALDTALRDAEELDDAQRLAKVTFWVGMFNYALGNHPAALADFQRCQEMSELVGPELFALTINYLGRVHFYLSDFPRSIEYLQRGLALLDEVQRPAEAVNSMGLLVMNYGFIGAFDQIPALAERIFQMASAVRNPTIESMGYVCTGLSGLMQGNWEEARRVLSKASSISHTLGNPIMEGLATWGQGFALTMLDDSDAGVARMNEGIAMIRSTESHLGLSAYLGEQSVIYLQLGQWQAARDFANQTLEMSQEGEKLGDDLAYSTLGRVAMRRPRPDWTEAQAHMERSLRISREKGARTLLCRTLFFYAELLHEQGEDERARACLKEARELFVAVGMQWWLEHSEPLHAALGD